MRRIATKGTETKKTGIIFAISVFTKSDAPNNAPKLSFVKYTMTQPIKDRNIAQIHTSFSCAFQPAKIFLAVMFTEQWLTSVAYSL